MDVIAEGKRETHERKSDGGAFVEVGLSETQAGFTLIESLVAMGLFVGVVLLLVSVFNEYLTDDFTTKLNRSLLVAEKQMDNVGRSKIFVNTEIDTMGFHVVQTVTMRKNVVLVDLEVRDTKKANTVYMRLSKAFPVR